MPKTARSRPLPRIEIDLAPRPREDDELLTALEARFEAHPHLHPGVSWPEVRARLDARPERFASLRAMESTGGEPNVVGRDPATGEILFCDCSAVSPVGRRSVCYDGAAQEERKKKGVQPAGNAVDLAAAMGIELLDEEQYRALQELAELDTKTSSWIRTPEDVRALGGALFADRRYGRVFVYHNGAPSSFAARGFRGSLRV